MKHPDTNMKPSEGLSLRETISRRELLRVGGLSCLSVSLASLLGSNARSAPAGVNAPASFGRAKSCLMIFLAGGPPQHETFDPKPDAPREIRGEFRPIATSAHGVQFCELLPESAKIAHRLTVIRSMTTDIHSHSTSGYYMLTGYPHSLKTESEPASRADWPSIAATVGKLKPSSRSPFSSVILPEPLRNNPNIPWPGQDGGYMGPHWDPHIFKCDPSERNFTIDGLTTPEGITDLRLDERVSLSRQLDEHFARVQRSDHITAFDRMQQNAFDVLRSGTTRAAFEMERESADTRDRYGRHKFGQSLLLGRRLIEAGVRLVQVNYPREPGDTTAGNPLWDTHQKNAERLKTVLCPTFDGAFAALIGDLHDRRMLDETLVVVMGEFGRTPRINDAGGRDHWGSVFSIALAGAGIPGGTVIGASDHDGAFPATRPIRPSDLAATIFHLLGIAPTAEFHDALARPRSVTDGGTAIREMVG
jgi:hypothetical protein